MNPLPLRLSPFEQSLWVDDCPAYPWNILFRLQFSGKLQREPLQRALQTVTARHPFFWARIRKRWTQRFRWEPAEHAAEIASPVLHWNEHKVGRRPPLRRLRIEAGESLEVWARDDDSLSEMFVQFSHLATDGVGAVTFFDELLQCYAAVVAGTDAELPERQPHRLQDRGRCGYSRLELLRLVPKLAVGLRGIRQFLGRKPLPLTPHEASPRTDALPPDYPLLLARTFTEAETAALRRRAKQEEATLNDLLTRDLFVTLHAWRRRRGWTTDDWLRLAVPVDMRCPEDAALPAANIVSMVFLDRRPVDAEDPAALLRSLHDEMKLIKDNHLGLIYLLMLGLTDSTPGLMAWLAQRQKFTCSAVFSNLMRPLEHSPLPRDKAGRLRVGPLTLHSFEFYPPVRPYSCAAFGAATYSNRLTLSLNADPRFLSAAEADELLDGLAGQLRATLTAP